MVCSLVDSVSLNIVSLSDHVHYNESYKKMHKRETAILTTLKVIFFLFLCIHVVASCQQGIAKKSKADGDTLQLKYAKNLTIVKHDGYTTIELLNPWKQNEKLATYILIEEGSKVSKDKFPNSTIIQVPLHRSVVSTAPHCQLFEWIDAVSSIKGVCDAQFIHTSSIMKQIENKQITNCGNSIMPDIERIIGIEADAIFVSPFENGNYGKIEKIGIPLIACADYMESTALGRAEWMKFYGLLFGCEAKADSLFNVVDSNYNVLKHLAQTAKSRPKVITERKTGSVWYCPGGASSLGSLFKDANVNYVFEEDKHSGSLSLSPETVIEKANDAEIWMFLYYGGRSLTKDVLQAEYKGYTQLHAFQTGNIFECNSATTPYFEEISFRPDFLLQEIILISHPELETEQSLRYYQKVRLRLMGV